MQSVYLRIIPKPQRDAKTTETETETKTVIYRFIPAIDIGSQILRELGRLSYRDGYSAYTGTESGKIDEHINKTHLRLRT